MIKTFVEDLIWTVKLWLLTSVVPIAATIMFTLWEILGVTFKDDYLSALKAFWADYYVTGHIANAEAWRIHLGLLFCIIYNN